MDTFITIRLCFAPICPYNVPHMAKEATNWTLYVLKLQGDKWYVDVTTDDPKTELKKHQNGAGTTWTQKYKAIDISNSKELGEISEDDAEKYAGKFIKKYMEHYGEGNVRGGDTPVGTASKAKAPGKKRFSLWNIYTQLIIIFLLAALAGYLLFDKFVLVPSTALTITQ